MEQNEAILIKRSQNGDNDAFAELIGSHEEKIYNLLLRMTANEAEAHDLFQETFLSAWKNVARFKGTAAFSTWLYRIAVNAVLMKRRKKKLRAVSLDSPIKTAAEEFQRELTADWSSNPLATLENQELKEKLEQAIAKLPETHKAVLVLSDMQGMANEAIGDILKISLANVKSRLHRARLFLRRELAHYFNPSPLKQKKVRSGSKSELLSLSAGAPTPGRIKSLK